MYAEPVTLTKEQAALLLPLLPSLVASATPPKHGIQEDSGEGGYTITQMFEKKSKNSKSTRAQNYLLVSVYFFQPAVRRQEYS